MEPKKSKTRVSGHERPWAHRCAALPLAEYNTATHGFARVPPRVRLRAGSLQGSKKKKELPKELRQDPPILRVLGRGMVGLEPLLMGEPLVSTVCNFGVIRTVESDKLTFLRVQQGPGHAPSH